VNLHSHILERVLIGNGLMCHHEKQEFDADGFGTSLHLKMKV
jgi:hypothetical protein